ncbi:MAG: ABC-type transport auxiliary lipoprotein family protein [Pseudomonadota bacterium]
MAAVAATLAMGGCGVLGGGAPPVRPNVYDFGSSARTTAPDIAPGQPIALGEVDAPFALDAPAVMYRLAYADAQQPRPYAQARWSMAPASLLRVRLRERLSQSRPVLQPGEAGVLRTLRVDLEEFHQVFDSPNASSGVVRLRATLLETSTTGERLLAQRNISVQRPAPSPDAQGGVRALTAATDAAIDVIDQWLKEQR